MLAFAGKGELATEAVDVNLALREMVERYFGFRPVVIGPGVRSGMPILYENPREVGTDRIVNSLAAVTFMGKRSMPRGAGPPFFSPTRLYWEPWHGHSN